MTGMGIARDQIDGISYTFEARSVNHRYCEVFVKLPSRLQSIEYLIVQHVKKRIQRGKLDIFLQFEDNHRFEPNLVSLKKYKQFLLSLQKNLQLEGPITLDHVLQNSHMWVEKSVDAEKLWTRLKKILDECLDKLIAMRQAEGKRLMTEIKKHLVFVEKICGKVKKQSPLLVTNYKKKLEVRIAQLLGGVQIETQRLAQEVAMMADRWDITEEIERLQSHFKQMKKVIEEGKPCGRTIDFLIQEMNREWNTIGSKSPDTSVSHDIVSAKAEMERMREQVQNIE